MATDVERLVVQLEANMRGYERAMQRVIGQTNRSAQRIEQRFERANRTVERGFAMMGRAAVSSLAAIGAAVGTAQLAKLAQDALAAAEGIADTGDRVGFAVERLQELRFAADQNGSSARTLDMALQRFSRRVGEAVNGTGELRDTLIQNRIQLRDTNGEMRDSYDILLDYADAIQNAESEQEALRMAFKAFDSEGAQLVTLMRQGREGIDRFAGRARELGLVLEENLVREGAEANRVIRNMRQEISGEFNRAVLENADALVTMAGALGQVAAAAIRATGALIDMFKDPEGSANITAEIEQLEARLRTLRAGGGRVEQIAGIEQRLESLRGQLSIALNFEAFQDWWESQAVEPSVSPSPPRGGAGGSAGDGSLEPLPPPVRVGDRPGTAGGSGGLMPSDSDIVKITTFFADELGDKTVDAIEAERERIAFAFENGFRAASQGGLLNFFAQNLRSAVFESVSQGLARAFAESLSGNVFGSLFSGLFTGSFSGRGKIPFGGGKASGGPVDAGRSYRVGERGPETFVPLQRGMIVPNGAALQASRAVTVVNQFHLHAEGAVMTDELLAEMDQKAMAAAQGAVAISRRDMAGARDRASKRLR